MEPTTGQPPLIVIVGETASGKTAMAIDIAKRFNGEIIAADSRTVYRGMSIGTAKPSASEMQGVRHHIIDVVSPDQSFSAADFKRLASHAIADISRRGKVPIMAGGTGLYVDSVLYDFSFGKLPDAKERQELQAKSVSELQAVLRSRSLPMPENDQNPRHLIRAIENDGLVMDRKELRTNTLLIGLLIDREVLKKRLERRVQAMIDNGFVDEARQLGAQYGWDTPALQSTGYRAFKHYFLGSQTLEESKEQFVRNDLQLAKRQRTWFRRNKSIHWISKSTEAVELVTTFLNNK